MWHDISVVVQTTLYFTVQHFGQQLFFSNVKRSAIWADFEEIKNISLIFIYCTHMLHFSIIFIIIKCKLALVTHYSVADAAVSTHWSLIRDPPNWFRPSPIAAYQGQFSVMLLLPAALVPHADKTKESTVKQWVHWPAAALKPLRGERYHWSVQHSAGKSWVLAFILMWF